MTKTIYTEVGQMDHEYTLIYGSWKKTNGTDD